MAKIVGKVKSTVVQSGKDGVVGGLAVGILSSMIGPLPGHIVGGILAGAFLGGTGGQIVATNAIMDSVDILVSPSQ